MYISTLPIRLTAFKLVTAASIHPSKRTGQNPPRGGCDLLLLERCAEGGTETKLEILDPTGKLIRK